MNSRAQRFYTPFRTSLKQSKTPGRLFLETLEDRTLPAGGYTQINLVDPNSTGSFDAPPAVSSLPNGNIVVAVPDDTVDGVANAGGVYLYSGSTGALISALTGSHTGDEIGSNGITVLKSGNIIVESSSWNGGMGAVTWINGVTGASDVVSASNSLVGSASSDAIGSLQPALLTNGNYVVVSPTWDNGDGSVTWGSGATGITGVVSNDNSFVGDPANNNGIDSDKLGSYGVTVLDNGNYVISSPQWNQGTGAVTWGNGATGSSGVVSAANSLVGSNNKDSVGGGSIASGVVPLQNGNYIVISPLWDGRTGAATWADGTMPTSATVSLANSLVGSTPGDQIGDSIYSTIDFTLLNSGNCVIVSPDWNNTVGAVTLLNATTGTFGVVSAANSLVGSTAGDTIGQNGATALSNGNFVIDSPFWNNHAGAATWGDGVNGIVGTVSAANSLVGNPGDSVGSSTTALANGNYVVASDAWNMNAGAVTWGNGAGGSVGTVSATNSLIGNPGDYVGRGGVTLLTNGNYVVDSSSWNQSSGAVTCDNGAGGTTGLVSAANSLVGNPGDVIGSTDYSSAGAITALPNGNYLVHSGNWQVYTGAVTWGNGSGGTVGLVSAANSIVGIPGDYTYNNPYSMNVVVLTNGNFVVVSGAGAVTWGNGAIGTSGTVSAANSFMSAASTSSGAGFNVIALPNGNYVIESPAWNNFTGAVTWVNGDTGMSGTPSPANSLVGSQSGDLVGATAGIGGYGSGVTPLSNGDFIVASTMWNKGSGALTICNGTQATTGPVSSNNSFVGVVPASFNDIFADGLGHGNFCTTATFVYDNHGFGSFNYSYVTLYQTTNTPPQFVSASQATFTLGIANSFTVKAVGSGAAILNVSDTLPAGLTFDPATGILSGTPTNLPAGAYYLTFTASDGTGSVYTQNFTLVIQQPITPPIEDYIAAVYYDLLGRPPETTGLSYWIGQLNGGVARAVFVNFMDHSPEYYGTIIEPAYLQFLGRPADPDGLTYWTSRMSGGLSDELLEAGFIGSPEFYQHSGGTDKGWVDALYQDLLGRNADPGGEAAWLQALAAGASRAAVAYGFAASIERESQHVMVLYQKYLGRSAGTSEIDYWLGQFGAGATNEDIVTGFASSGEFFQEHS